MGIYTLTFSSLGSVLATSTVVIGGDFYKRLKSSIESGVAPLNVTFLLAPNPRNGFKNFDTIDFGDGTTGVLKWKESGNIPEWDLPLETSHVYNSPGSYDAKYSGSGGYGDHVHISVRNH